MVNPQEVKPTMDEVFEMIDAALKFDPEVTTGKEGVYQFNMQGEEDGTYQMIIDDDDPRAVQGEKSGGCS